LAISPPTDLVLDVLRAADPQAAEAARAKLASLAPSTASEPFSVDASQPARSARTTQPMDAHQKFEAMVLQSFLQSMMPAEGEATFGGGLAGDMWKGMLAEQIAGVMAKRGGIGIAERVLGDYTFNRDEKVALAGSTTEETNGVRGDNGLLSTALLDEMQRRLVQSLRESDAVGERHV
jgi:peptidoglycan hydrolase FlgJ